MVRVGDSPNLIIKALGNLKNEEKREKQRQKREEKKASGLDSFIIHLGCQSMSTQMDDS